MSKNQNLIALRAARALPENSYGYNARCLLLAYGLVRGLPMERLESKNSDPYAFPSPGSLADLAARYHRPAAEGVSETEHAATVKAFRDQTYKVLVAWHKQLYIHWAELDIQKRARNVAKRTGTRTHTSKPADLASRGA